MRSSNVLPFREPRPSGESWGIRFFAAVFYLYLAMILAPLNRMPLNPGGLTFLVVLALLYWFFIHRQMHRDRHFRQQGLALAIIGLLLLIFFLQWQVMSILILLALYWLLIYRPIGDAPYFLRFQMLTALVLNTFLWLGFMLLHHVVDFVFFMLQTVRLPFLGIVESFYGTYFFPVVTAVFWVFAVFLAINALLGRTPHLPLVTGNVRYWA